MTMTGFISCHQEQKPESAEDPDSATLDSRGLVAADGRARAWIYRPTCLITTDQAAAAARGVME